ncbi:TfoX/Sxy family protein [Imbroritus primus]|uniref:TfoX/Sxy family protein n=1 Tax=Imbroritus primus TaxID=3058603 RepID=A0ACD3SLK7_9BURK|nr:TfoX/Sxy family protein [Burkholderiaceae bacterium PBA]
MTKRTPDPLIQHVLELMAPLATRVGPLTAKRMFGGHGLFYDGLMFGLVSDGQLYFKCDAATRAIFEAAGAQPFRYAKAQREVVMASYWSAPESCLEDAAQMAAWAQRAVEAALRLANAEVRTRRRVSRTAVDGVCSHGPPD